MKRKWLITILCLSFTLLALLEAHRVCEIQSFFKAEKSIKLKRFNEIKNRYSVKDQELLELWESMLTGRVAPVSKWMKDRYKLLGLNHLFTPSGFHLSAVLSPLFKFFQNSKFHFIILVFVCSGLMFLPGQGALKRMSLIKLNQKLLGQHLGFVIALTLDVLFGTFQSGALSFTYSFLFLGIIYSGLEGVALIIWFFIAQMILAYFQNAHLSPLLLLISPILNLGFGLAMPVLFVLALPAWEFQIDIGLFILRWLQRAVDCSALIIENFPVWEIHLGTLVLVSFFLFKQRRAFLILMLFFSHSLNLDLQKNQSLGSDFVPQGSVVKIILGEEKDVIYFINGKCSRKLVRGFWFERCSPKRKSTHRKKQIMKLSYL